MSSIFINYRTGDGEAGAALVERELSRRFGTRKVFRASKSIKPGEDFERALLRAVRRSDALVAIIGPRWLTAEDGNGHRALDNDDDWTRREIAEAFACDVPVIPLLVGKTNRLTDAHLPAELEPLTRCQYLRLSFTNVEADIDRLAGELAGLMPDLEDRTGAGEETGSRSNSTIVVSDKVNIGGDLFGGDKYDGLR
jgi:hypothetical protein